jgi:hypothetical protein
MTFEVISLDSKIEDKISWATNCFKKKKSVLFNDKKTRELLDLLKKAITASRREMEDIGLVEECRQCEEKEGGACCGAGIENRYSGILLLINLLLETNLPQQPYETDSCYFLSAHGCSLTARQVLCVNYICNKISNKISPEKLIGLREKEGVELDLLFLLNERIKMVLKNG